MILRMQRLGEEPAKVAGCDEPVVGVVEKQVLVVLLQPDIVKYPHLMMTMMLMISMIFLITMRGSWCEKAAWPSSVTGRGVREHPLSGNSHTRCCSTTDAPTTIHYHCSVCTKF